LECDSQTFSESPNVTVEDSHKNIIEMIDPIYFLFFIFYQFHVTANEPFTISKETHGSTRQQSIQDTQRLALSQEGNQING
jgi:endo-1,4-beta-D-glucanase Y